MVLRGTWQVGAYAGQLQVLQGRAQVPKQQNIHSVKLMLNLVNPVSVFRLTSGLWGGGVKGLPFFYPVRIDINFVYYFEKLRKLIIPYFLYFFKGNTKYFQIIS